MQIIEFIIEIVFIFIISTVIFDLIHYLLHQMQGSQISIFRRLGALHDHHHLFFDDQLVTHKELWPMNLKYHLVPELITQLAVTSCFFFFVNPMAVGVTLGCEMLIFIYVLSIKGLDFNHLHNPKLSKKPSMAFFVMPNYHYQHHLDPKNYFSSWFRIFDFLFGYSCSLKGKCYLVTGASGKFGSQLCVRLEKYGAKVIKIKYGKDFDHDRYDGFKDKIKLADGLILCHGSKGDCQWSHVDSYIEMIESFLENTKADLPEIWALGSEMEFHPAFFKADKPYEKAKRDFALYAKKLYHREDILYRHIVPAAFQSSYNPAPISARPFSWLALFFVQRGFRYIPLTYTGMAYLNYFKFKRE